MDQSRAVDLAKALFESKDADVKTAGLGLRDNTLKYEVIEKMSSDAFQAKQKTKKKHYLWNSI